ncbi:DUF2608 domain-containing protein [Microbulbifer sp. ANSA003]|uniref:DUF2608 domain-containing protein n=1 Tax=unclassified Microbulbifer TaxID=2619833 RepID=UPI0024AC8BCB|nr:DUF2608 domain-containing protein [Microbulbifer sp. VAAF005]WHI46747.1 DUF2608 domain-containing protein [Microbulbifer sp. VAAF005]
MSKFNSLLYSIVLIVASHCVSAGAIKKEVNSFEDVQNIIEESATPINTLLVMDNDDTLSMMPCAEKSQCQYLGGAAWYSWQETLLETDPNSGFLVAKTKEELINISGLLFSVSNMVYTDDNIVPVLDSLRQSGVRLMVETARGDADVSATERQFKRLPTPNTSYQNLLELIRSNTLNFSPNNQFSLASPFKPCDLSEARPVSYRQGIMYLAGQDKGFMLDCLLRSYNSSANSSEHYLISNIIFIDDSFENVESVYQAFKDNKKYEVIALHYTRLSKHKQDFMDGPQKKALQETAKKRWETIMASLNSALLMPAVEN